MRVICENCGASYTVPDSKLTKAMNKAKTGITPQRNLQKAGKMCGVGIAIKYFPISLSLYQPAKAHL